MRKSVHQTFTKDLVTEPKSRWIVPENILLSKSKTTPGQIVKKEITYYENHGSDSWGSIRI